LACARLLPDRCMATALVAGAAPFVEAPELFMAETAGFLRRVETGDETELVKDCNETMESFSGARAETMAERFTSVADRESMTGRFADWLAETFRAAFVSGIEGLREDQVAFAHDWGFKVADARRVAIWHGAEDGMVRVGHGVWLGEHIPNAEVHILPREGNVSIVLRFREILDDLISRSQPLDREATSTG